MVPEVDVTDHGVFISYRRSDSPAHAGRLFDHLTDQFGDRVFMDVDTVRPGDDFARAIDSAIGSCDAMVVVIGSEWLTASDEKGGRRLDDPHDFVRREIATALEHGINVIPVLVEGVQMPDPELLPADIAPLAMRNAVELSETRWSFDVERLITALSASMEKPPLEKGRFVWRGRRPTLVLVISAAASVVSLAVIARSCTDASPKAVPSNTTTEPADPPLLEFGADQCVQGFVWREATPDDHVCVTPEVRDAALADNANKEARWVDPLASPPLCVAGYQWRFATAIDYVCVLPETWRQAQLDNQAAESRKVINANG